MKAGAVHAAFRALPVAGLGTILPGTTLLLAPHADDESLGCGGLIAALCDEGRPPVVVVLTDGAGSHPGSASWPGERLRAEREREAARATGLLGLPEGRLHFLRLADTASPTAGPAFEDAVHDLSRIAAAEGCGTVLTTWGHDPHRDHESAWLIGRAVALDGGLRLLAYPVWGWLIDAGVELDVAQPAGWRFDVTRWRAVKARAIAAHETQYGGLIDDDPDGFRLPAALLAVFAQRFETVLLP
jgi:LmbE family N-acetylglucosaminyl deacetylase